MSKFVFYLYKFEWLMMDVFFNTFSVLIYTSIILLWLFFKNKHEYWQKKGIVSPPNACFFGHSKSLITREKSFADRSMEFYSYFKSKGLKHGGIYTLWKPMYIPIDINIIKHIMQIDFQHFTDRGIYTNEKIDPLSAHLFSLGGIKWKLLRRKLTPTFTSGKMKMMYETVVGCTRELYDVMDNDLGKPVDIKEILGRFTTDIIGNCAFGLDCNSLKNPDSEFRRKGKAFFEKPFLGSMKSIFLFLFPEFSKKLNLRFLNRSISKFFIGIVEKNVAYRENNNVFRRDFMHLLIQLKNTGKLVDDEKLGEEKIPSSQNTITLNEIAAQAFVFFIAGFETSSTAMTFCLYELAKNKVIQDKLRANIREIMANHGNKLTYEAAMEMNYLDQVINETLRKYPPLPHLNRICTKEYMIPGTDIIIEKGVAVLIPIMGLHRDPDIYPDPDKFDPDRFTEENIKNRDAFTFLPFGDGPRACIGTRFGMMQTRVGLTALLVNYEFTVSKKTKEPIEFDRATFPTTTKGGMWLNFKKLAPKHIELLEHNRIC